MRVCFSGTFNVLHIGHKKLIDKAFELAGPQGSVHIGISEGKLIENKKYKIPIEQRLSNLKEYLKEKGYTSRATIKVIRDEFDKAATGDYDTMIVSPETIKNAEELNEIRIKNGKKPLKLFKVEYVLADDNKPISSTRILDKEIDEEGRVPSN